jgi:DNA polymerase-3 subunit gamma/tau
MLAGTALDVLEIDAASNRGIDEIRALREAVKFAPAAMRMKVYIVDEAHMLTKEGANAFLKTLEEPPPHAVFILATTEPDKLPVTILSRCQRYTFRRISVPVIIEKLREVAQGEEIAINDEALSAIAYRADGGLRDALTMLEQIAAFAGGAPATAATLDLAFGATGRQFAAALLEACVRGDATAALAVVEEASDAGTDLQVLIRSLIVALRNLLVARIDPQLLARDLAAEDAARAGEQASKISQAMLVRALRTFTEALALARSGGNARLELETALLRFILTGEDPTLDALSARLAALEDRGPVASPPPVAAVASPPPAASPEPAPASPAPPPESPQKGTAGSAPLPSSTAGAPALSLQKVRAAWQSIRGKVEGERPPLRAPLSRATVESLESNAIVLKLPDTWSAGALRDYAPLIEKAVADVLGVELKVVLRVDGSAGRAKSASRGGEPAAPAKDGDDADALFEYANERIR